MPVKLIVAGSRGHDNDESREAILAWLVANVDPGAVDEVVSGTCRGPDRFGETWANRHGIKVKRFPALWDMLGKRAGFVRNEAMARYADALVAFPTEGSRGTWHMIRHARDLGLDVVVVEPDEL